jgi:hypothetical protein
VKISQNDILHKLKFEPLLREKVYRDRFRNVEIFFDYHGIGVNQLSQEEVCEKYGLSRQAITEIVKRELDWLKHPKRRRYFSSAEQGDDAPT